MRVSWHFTKADEKCVKTIIEEQRNDPLVKKRKTRNLAKVKDEITRAGFWRALVCMRLTTQARIGPTGKLADFQRSTPFALRYDRVRTEAQPESFILQTLNQYQAGRHRNVISKQLARNLEFLQGGGWNPTIRNCNKLTTLQSRYVEAGSSELFSGHFRGVRTEAITERPTISWFNPL